MAPRGYWCQGASFAARGLPGQPLGSIERMVGDDYVRTRALDSRQDLERNPLLVEPAIRGRGLDHSVFAADIVRPEREVDTVADGADDVEVGERRLNHHHVCALR